MLPSQAVEKILIVFFEQLIVEFIAFCKGIHMMKRHYLIFLFCFLVKCGGLHANDAAWKVATGGDWNTDGNWTATHPDAIDAIAGFVGFPLPPPATATITSTTNITVVPLFSTPQQP